MGCGVLLGGSGVGVMLAVGRNRWASVCRGASRSGYGVAVGRGVRDGVIVGGSTAVGVIRASAG